MNKTIQLFTKNGCIQCKMTKKFLSDNEVSFEEHNVNDQPEALSFLKEKGFKSLPVILLQNKSAIVGFRLDELKTLVS